MTYRVELPVFCGPLDLLLHLVKQQEVDIHEVRIADILGQYLKYLEVLEALDLADLGDFLVMASTLMEIKSRDLLPREEVEISEELDPRDDLIRRLLEYKRFRDISRRLDRLSRRRSRQLEASLPLPKELRDSLEEEDLLDLGGIEIWALTSVFAKLLEETGQVSKKLNIGVDKRNIRFFTERVLEQVRSRPEVAFRELFRKEEGRMALIGTFIAVLEMMKQGVLKAHQSPGFGEIMVAFRGDSGLTVEEILASDHRVDSLDEGDGVDKAAAVDAALDGSPGLTGLSGDASLGSLN